MQVTTVPAPTPVTFATDKGPFKGTPTWLCRFTVMADMPSTMSIADMEGVIAGTLASGLMNLGLPANVSAKIEATAGNQTVLDPTPPLQVTPVVPVVPLV